MKELSKGRTLHVASAKAGMCEKTARRYRDALRLPSELKVVIRQNDAGVQWEATKPTGAGELQIGFRKLPTEPFGQTKGQTPDNLRASFNAANASLGFANLPGLSANEKWQGIFSKPGLYRLVTIADGKLYATTIDIPPPSAPATE